MKDQKKEEKFQKQVRQAFFKVNPARHIGALGDAGKIKNMVLLSTYIDALSVPSMPRYLYQAIENGDTAKAVDTAPSVTSIKTVNLTYSGFLWLDRWCALLTFPNIGWSKIEDFIFIFFNIWCGKIKRT